MDEDKKLYASDLFCVIFTFFLFVCLYKGIRAESIETLRLCGLGFWIFAALAICSGIIWYTMYNREANENQKA